MVTEEEGEKWDLWGQFFDLTDRECYYYDNHHFVNPANFCLENGKLRIVDYGSPATRQVVKKWGVILHEKVRVDI